MKGRSRAFTIAKPVRVGQLGAVGRVQRPLRRHRGDDRARPRANQPPIEPGVIEFLNSKTVLRWAEVTLGL